MYWTSFSRELLNFHNGLPLINSVKERPDALAVCRAHRGLPVGFLLLRYSV